MAPLAEPSAAPGLDIRKGPALPYPGLRPFRPEEWSIFCGREQLVELLIDRLEERKLLLVHGGSGSGKSSLVAAGILPTLYHEHLRAGVTFAFRIFRPSEGPFIALAQALADLLGPPEGRPDADSSESMSVEWLATADHAEQAAAFRNEGQPLRADRKADAQWATLLMSGDDIVATIDRTMTRAKIETLCLVVDQFEEIFSWARDRRSADVEILVRFLSCVAQRGPGTERSRLFVLATMRSDFIGACVRFPALADIINDNQFFLPGLSQERIARSIVEPAELFGGTVEAPLVRRLMLDAASSADPLPLMQHALMRMASRVMDDRREGWTLTLDHLDAIGGEGMDPLSAHADGIYALLSDRYGAPGEEAMEWIFRALLDVEKSGEATRRPRDFGQLLMVAGPQPATDQLRAMIEDIVGTFAAEGNNLLVVSPSAEGPDLRRVDIAHEALLRRWARVAGTRGRADTGWKPREVADRLMWQGLALQGHGGLLLSARVLTEARRFFMRMRAAPERARRYLANQAAIDDVTESKEWRSVAQIVRRSQWLQAALGFVLIALVVALPGYIFVRQAGQEGNLEKKKAALVQQEGQLDGLQNNLTEALAIVQADARVQADAVPSTNASQQSEVIESGTQISALETLAGQGVKGGGYIWVADGSPQLLETAQGRPVGPAQIAVGGVYRARYDIAVRAGLPSPPNRSAPRIGIVRKDALIFALGKPELWPNSGQYWLHQQPLPTVWLQVSPETAARGRQLASQLAANGFQIKAPQILAQARGQREIRFCNPADSEAATALAARLTQMNYGAIGTRAIRLASCAGVPQGTLEIWLGEPKAGPQ